jgi:hypothetical protein
VKHVQNALEIKRRTSVTVQLAPVKLDSPATGQLMPGAGTQLELTLKHRTLELFGRHFSARPFYTDTDRTLERGRFLLVAEMRWRDARLTKRDGWLRERVMWLSGLEKNKVGGAAHNLL